MNAPEFSCEAIEKEDWSLILHHCKCCCKACVTLSDKRFTLTVQKQSVELHGCAHAPVTETTEYSVGLRPASSHVGERLAL